MRNSKKDAINIICMQLQLSRSLYESEIVCS